VSGDSGAGESASRRSCVLVATSDSATRDLLRRILHVGAVDVVDAADGVEALALARRLDLDLIVLDAFLAVVDGISVCGRIRALTDIDQPSILMVGLISERAVEVALSVGADETLSKPLNPALIRSRTRALLTRRQEERRLRLVQRVLEAAPVAVTLLDARSSEYLVTHANPAFRELTGHSAEEIRGRDLRLLTGPDTDVTAITALRDAMAAGRPARVLLKSYRRDGRPFWNDLATAPVVDEGGRLTHYVAAQHDVTSLVEAPVHKAARAIEESVLERTHALDSALVRVEKRRRFAETILNSMVSAILTTDTRGTVTFANLAALRTLGTSVAQCVGRSVVELFGHNDAVAEIVGAPAPTQPEHRLDFPMITPGGARIYVGVSIVHPPAEFRDEVGLLFLFRNLAETILDERDPRLTRLTEAAPGAGETSRDEPPAAGGGEATGEPLAAAPSPPGVEGSADGPEPRAGDGRLARRRVLLNLRYTAPGDLVREVVDRVGAQRPGGRPVVRLEAAADVPEVLLDRPQAIEALSLLLASTLDRCGHDAEVCVRVRRGELARRRGGRPDAAARIEIVSPRESGADAEPRPEGEGAGHRAYRRTDLAAAETLIEANGGRLVRPRRDAEESALTVLLPAAG
jgi:PAS domain S-box-containing protein